MAGYSVSTVSGEKTNDDENTSPDYWIVKLDGDFNIKWDKAFGRSPEYEGAAYYNILNSVQQTSDGGYILSGTSQDVGDIYGSSFYILKCDSAGDIQWSKDIGVGEATGAYT